MNRPLTIQDWFESLGKMVEEFDWEGNGMSEQDKDWTPCIKLPVIVHVRKQREGETHVSTREGITPVKPDDLIMRGVSGEEYPIGREIFEKTYTLDVAAPVEHTICLNPIHKETICSKNQDFYTHKQEPEPVAWMYQNKNTDHQYLVWNKSEGGRNWQPLYTHPKEWVGLTDEDISLALGFGEFRSEEHTSELQSH